MKYELPQLAYAYDDLEPYIDAKTMEIHHSKHHQGYVDKLNAVLEKYQGLADRTLDDLLTNLNNLEMEKADKIALKNNGGGHFNHSLFWNIMGALKQVDEKLKEEIGAEFGSVEEFKTKFSDVAKTQFGSGWAWLVKDTDGKLQIYGLPNQDCPLTLGHTPLIGLDVWEHAYYLKYQNRRPEYVENWWNVLTLI